MDAPRLPLNIADLLHRRVIESERIEFKAGWNPEPILHTLCAFANDFQNLGGGYIVIGVEAEDGEPSLPPRGVPRGQLDRIQQELLRLGNLIQPAYFPVVGIESYQGREVMVLWAPGGQSRPYKAPRKPFSDDKQHHYYIRRYTSTVVAKDAELHELISLTASVPFDDRINHTCRATRPEATVDPDVLARSQKRPAGAVRRDALSGPLPPDGDRGRRP